MQDISFAVARFLEASFQLLVVLDWLPVVAFSLIMAGGALYWLMLQGRYNRQAREKGTLA